ncbi:hypothetical protein D6D17_10320 [Aureobasidium pullulans]|nr:hypothetical protein D6D17_10320 [Aureobasidium pullulans]
MFPAPSQTYASLRRKSESVQLLSLRSLSPSSSPSRPLNAPARSHVQDPDPSPPQNLVQFGESNDDIPLPIHSVAPRHEDCPTTQSMYSSLKATPPFDGKLGTTRADVDAVPDEFVDQPAVNAPSVQDHHDPEATPLKIAPHARRDAGLDVHGQDLEMAARIPTTHQFTDFQCDAAPNKKIRTLEAKVADLTEQLHNVCRYYNMLMDEIKASSGIASTAPSAKNAITPTISPPYDLSDTAATLFALSERNLWRCATEAGSVRNDVLIRLISPPHSEIDARIGELQSALYNEATFHGQARVQFEEMAKSATKMAAAEAE